MTKLEQLIKEKCPNGVEYKTLQELGEFVSGLTGKKKDDFVDGNAKFITYMNCYKNPALKIDVDDKVKINPGEKQNTLEYGDVIFTGSSENLEEAGLTSVLTTKTDEKLYLNSFCFAFRFSDKNLFLPDFSKHLFRSEYLRKQIKRCVSGVTRFNVSKAKLASVQLPVPPLEVQREIAEILDKFTLLTAELTAELTARKEQFENYRESLFNKTCEDSINYLEIKDLADVGTGRSNGNEAVEDGMYPFFIRSQIVKHKSDYEYDEEAITIPGEGGIGDIFHYVNGKYALHQRVYRIHFFDERINTKFVYYYMKQYFKRFIIKKAVNATVSSIRKPMIEEFSIPIISLKEQQRIVDILDGFDTLCNDISSGLPAEIEARQKQYEYYRNKLLTFKRLEA